MNKIIPLKEIQSEYEEAIQELLKKDLKLTLDNAIELFKQSFYTIKTKEIPANIPSLDILLYQSGIHHSNELGTYFSFTIVRQLSRKNFRMYQLSLTLIYNAMPFAGIESYSSRSIHFNNLDEWINDIQKTEGYKTAKENICKNYHVSFERFDPWG